MRQTLKADKIEKLNLEIIGVLSYCFLMTRLRCAQTKSRDNTLENTTASKVTNSNP